jgi:nucleoside-diphosphate-sugar epimerase
MRAMICCTSRSSRESVKRYIRKSHSVGIFTLPFAPVVVEFVRFGYVRNNDGRGGLLDGRMARSQRCGRGVRMNVFVAGGSGTIGVPLVRALVARGNRVAATTRSPERASLVSRLGAMPIVVDALDAQALEHAVQRSAPTHVIHQLTALPKGGPRRASDLEPTNRLRDEGTRNLLRAAIASNVQRIVVGSFGPLAVVEDVARDRGIAAVKSMESQTLEAAADGAIEGIVLRYGLFYGPDNPATQELLTLVRKRRLPRVRNDHGQLPFIHLDDAVTATLAALDRGRSGGVYDIVDDHPASFSEFVAEMAEISAAPRPFEVPRWVLRLSAPYMSRMLSARVPMSNAKARQELAWVPQSPSYREGLRQMMASPT